MLEIPDSNPNSPHRADEGGRAGASLRYLDGAPRPRRQGRGSEAAFPAAHPRRGPLDRVRFLPTSSSGDPSPSGDLGAIEPRWRRSSPADEPFVKSVVDRRGDRALRTPGAKFKAHKHPTSPSSGQGSVVLRDGNFFDLAAARTQRTGQIGVVQRLSIAGAYWRARRIPLN